MAQTTIWLPGDLHEQVKAAGLNMSQVCQQALRTALAEKVEVADATDLDAIVARLRASKEQQSKEIYQRGVSQGRDWAARSADWSELVAMSNNPDRWEPERGSQLEAEFGLDAREAADCGEPWDYSIVLHGFRAGAMEIYRTVADRL